MRIVGTDYEPSDDRATLGVSHSMHWAATVLGSPGTKGAGTCSPVIKNSESATVNWLANNHNHVIEEHPGQRPHTGKGPASSEQGVRVSSLATLVFPSHSLVCFILTQSLTLDIVCLYPWDKAPQQLGTSTYALLTLYPQLVAQGITGVNHWHQALWHSCRNRHI